jgi:hypothetical protein
MPGKHKFEEQLAALDALCQLPPEARIERDAQNASVLRGLTLCDPVSSVLEILILAFTIALNPHRRVTLSTCPASASSKNN